MRRPLDQSSEKKKSKTNHKLHMKNIPPEEIVIGEIFLRLPATSVIRLSSACKSWRSSTVRHLPFLNSHRARWSQSQTQGQGRPSSCLILKDFYCAQMARIQVEDDMVNNNNKKEAEDLLLPSAPTDPSSLCLVASCDSLLCFAIKGMKYYYVHNLSTKDWIIVPTALRQGGYLHAYQRAFYYHPSTGEYRILTWFKLLPSAANIPEQQQQPSPPPLPPPTFGVLSLKLGAKWRVIDAQSPSHPPHCPVDLSRLTQGDDVFQPRAIARGHVHWPPMSNYPWILAFDVVTEHFTQIDIPRPLKQHRQHSQTSRAFYIERYQVMTLGQELVLSCTRLPWEIELWLLKDYKDEEECWVKLHTISIPSIINDIPSANHNDRKYDMVFFQPVGLCSGAADGGDLLLLRISAKGFILYCLISKRIKWVTAHQSCGLFAALLTDTLPSLMYSFN